MNKKQIFKLHNWDLDFLRNFVKNCSNENANYDEYNYFQLKIKDMNKNYSQPDKKESIKKIKNHILEKLQKTRIYWNQKSGTFEIIDENDYDYYHESIDDIYEYPEKDENNFRIFDGNRFKKECETKSEFNEDYDMHYHKKIRTKSFDLLEELINKNIYALKKIKIFGERISYRNREDGTQILQFFYYLSGEVNFSKKNISVSILPFLLGKERLENNFKKEKKEIYITFCTCEDIIIFCSYFKIFENFCFDFNEKIIELKKQQKFSHFGYDFDQNEMSISSLAKTFFVYFQTKKILIDLIGNINITRIILEYILI